jgi:hypothetical protein
MAEKKSTGKAISFGCEASSMSAAFVVCFPGLCFEFIVPQYLQIYRYL